MDTVSPARAVGLLTDLEGIIAKSLVPLIEGRAGNICLIDPPDHSNVGDSAILLGELSFLQRYFPTAKLTYYDVNNYSDAHDRHIEEATILLMHGGGNFGSLWPVHHEFRLRILKKFAHKPIVHFPQSIRFDGPASALATTAVLASQFDFTLATRDQNSFNYAERQLRCKALLVPDMAFAMAPIQREALLMDYFCLFRSDKEKVADHQSYY